VTKPNRGFTIYKIKHKKNDEVKEIPNGIKEEKNNV